MDKALVLLKLEAVIQRMRHINCQSERDLAVAGSWSCNYEALFQEMQQEFDYLNGLLKLS